jgi:hypothetical protein
MNAESLPTKQLEDVCWNSEYRECSHLLGSCRVVGVEGFRIRGPAHNNIWVELFFNFCLFLAGPTESKASPWRSEAGGFFHGCPPQDTSDELNDLSYVKLNLSLYWIHVLEGIPFRYWT